ncbi:MAG: ABC transporter ATP-binding protein [Alkaliphilus sp.]
MVIETTGLVKDYGKFRALSDISFNVKEGEIHGFLGPNGAGKTTTIRILLGFIEKSGGEALMWGKPVSKSNTDQRKRLGYLPSDIVYPGSMTGAEVIDFAMLARGVNAKARKKELVKLLDIDLSKKIKDCSKGMRQKIGIIQTLVHEPELILLDEPTTGLDPLMQNVFKELMMEEQSKGRTILMSSHVLSDVELICDRVTMIRKGKVVLTDTMEQIKKEKVKRVTIHYQGKITNLTECQYIFNLKQQSDNKVIFDIAGNINVVMAVLANIEIDDIAIEALSLEEIFMNYYKITDGGSNQ